MTRVGGIVLCGGQSSRMGLPKAWLPFGNELMLQRVVRVLREVVDPIVVVAARGQGVPPLPSEVEIVRDEIEGKGPLGGLAAGLAALEGQVEAAYLSSCDVPFLKPEFVEKILGCLSGGRQLLLLGSQGADAPRSEHAQWADVARSVSIAVPRVGDFFHPLAAAYRISVLPIVRELIAAERLRTVLLFDAVSTRVIESHELANSDPKFLSLRNLNTPDEYEAARLELSSLIPDS